MFSKRTTLFIGGGILIVLAAFFFGAIGANARMISVFPDNFFIGTNNVSRTSLSSAEALVRAEAKKLEERRISVFVPDYGVQSLPVKGSYSVNIEQTMINARSAAAKQGVWKKIAGFTGILSTTHVDLVITQGGDAAQSLHTAIESWKLPLKKAQDARFEISTASVTSTADFLVAPAVSGESLNESALLENISEAVRSSSDAVVNASIVTSIPEVSTAAAEQLAPEAKAVAAEIKRGRTLVISGIKFPLTSTQLIGLLQPHIVNGDVVVRIDSAILKAALGSDIVPFEHGGIDAKFVQVGNKVTTFIPDQKGVVIDWDGTSADLSASLKTASTTLKIRTKELEAGSPLSKTNDLGIKELLGSGTSDFSGSPKNRIHNITIGMNSVNGTLIAPGEIFSLIKTLGTIDGTTGYLQELVKKDNKTLPEFGGGLCQIGTTSFRAAMGAGFPIVERRNHSYQVKYYFENGVSGTDATIYDPKPDFRFKNDTAHWALFVTHMKGSILTFELWGTKDGRAASRTIPVVLARQPAPPRKDIDSTDIPVGTTKCTEHAHAGATTLFSYSIV